MHRTVLCSLLALALTTGCKRATIDPASPDADGDGFTADADCNDGDPLVSPDAEELCDGIDNNCDGDIDEDTATNAAIWYQDSDGDGFGRDTSTLTQCAEPDGYAATSGDCNDANADVRPDAPEVCDGQDNDCDDIADTDAVDRSSWYADTDDDGYGDPEDSVLTCDVPDGYVQINLDCDDTNTDINPDADEACDSVDNNCDGQIDEDTAIDAVLHYADNDGDRFGDANDMAVSCRVPDGRVTDDTDCNDAAEAINSDAIEVCDGVDNDCDGLTDDDSAQDVTTAYRDSDADTFGDPANSDIFCEVPSTHVVDNTDCDDTLADVYPGAPDRPADGLDNDCADDGDYIPTLYVIDRYIGELWALNRVTGERLWTAETGDENIDVAVGPDGDIYATSYLLGNVVRFAPEDGAIVRTYALDFGFVHGIQYDFSTDTLILAVPSQGVFELDPDSGETTLLVEDRDTLIGAFRRSDETDVYFTSRTNPGVWKGDPDTGLSERIATPTLRPNLLIPSAAGGFYVSGQLGGVEEVGVPGQLARAIGESDLILYGSCADPLGGDNLIVNDHTDATYTFDTVTGELLPLTTGLGTTWGCASDLPHDADGDGSISAVLGGPDCDDYDATISPDAVDDSVDGIDQNCDRLDGLDADGDGVLAASLGGADCNDDNATVYPGASDCPTTAETCAVLIADVPGAQSGPHTLADGAVVYCDMDLMTGGWTLLARSLTECEGSPECVQGVAANTDASLGWSSSTGDYTGVAPYSKDIGTYAGPIRELAMGSVSTTGQWAEHIYTHVALPDDWLTAGASTAVEVGPALTVRGECANGPTMLDQAGFFEIPDYRFFRDRAGLESFGLTAGGWSLFHANDCGLTGQLNGWAGQIMAR
ncbi:MAG: hypothetical protein ACJARS_004962 [bacterium]|jgi:hypothetical protein